MSAPHGIGHNGGPRFDEAPHRSPHRLLYDIAEARQILGGIGRSSIYKLIQAGKLKSVKVGSRTMLTGDELERFARSLARAA
jgi:excisionase family DNA binding protein